MDRYTPRAEYRGQAPARVKVSHFRRQCHHAQRRNARDFPARRSACHHPTGRKNIHTPHPPEEALQIAQIKALLLIAQILEERLEAPS
jgi:hypothetical protein